MDKDHLKALEDMQESIEFQVRRRAGKQDGHEAVPIVNGGASTTDEERNGIIASLVMERDELADLLREAIVEINAAYSGTHTLPLDHPARLFTAKVLAKLKGASTVAQDK